MAERSPRTVRERYRYPARDPWMWTAVLVNVLSVIRLWPSPVAAAGGSLIVGALLGFMLGWGRR